MSKRMISFLLLFLFNFANFSYCMDLTKANLKAGAINAKHNTKALINNAKTNLEILRNLKREDIINYLKSITRKDIERFISKNGHKFWFGLALFLFLYGSKKLIKQPKIINRETNPNLLKPIDQDVPEYDQDQIERSLQIAREFNSRFEEQTFEPDRWGILRRKININYPQLDRVIEEEINKYARTYLTEDQVALSNRIEQGELSYGEIIKAYFGIKIPNFSLPKDPGSIGKYIIFLSFIFAVTGYWHKSIYKKLKNA